MNRQDSLAPGLLQSGEPHMGLLPAENIADLVIIRCARLLYGIDVKWAREIQPFTQITPVYGLPAFWAGITALRGQLYAVLDLQQILSPHQAPAKNRRRGVFTVANHMAVGLLGDEILAARPVDAKTLTAVPSPAPSYLTGTTPDQVTVIDLPVLFAEPWLAALANRTDDEKA